MNNFSQCKKKLLGLMGDITISGADSQETMVGEEVEALSVPINGGNGGEKLQ